METLAKALHSGTGVCRRSATWLMAPRRKENEGQRIMEISRQ